jgi:hypothetical protein
VCFGNASLWRALLPYIIKHWQEFGSFFLDTGLIPPGIKKKKRERERQGGGFVKQNAQGVS